MKTIFLNLLFFKIAWTASVFGAAAGVPLAGLAAVAIAVAFHLFRARDARAEVCLLAVAALFGLAWESTLVAAGLLDYGDTASGVAPFWIVGMWVLFATTLNVGMRWLHRSTLVAMAAGAIGGPLSFFAGSKAGAVTVGSGE